MVDARVPETSLPNGHLLRVFKHIFTQLRTWRILLNVVTTVRKSASIRVRINDAYCRQEWRKILEEVETRIDRD